MSKVKKLLVLTVFLTLFSMNSLSISANDISSDDFESNTWSGGTGWNGAWTAEPNCEITTLSNPFGTYQARCDLNDMMTRSFDNSDYSEVNITFWATAGSLESADFCRYYYYDGTTYNEILSLTDGDDDITLDYYNINVTGYGVSSSAGFRMWADSGNADWCYVDNVTIIGSVGVDLNLYTELQYLTGETDVVIEADSSLTSTEHTISLYYPNGTMFCENNVTSPAVPNTIFSTTCDMPNLPYDNAYAVLKVTAEPEYNTTNYFNITQSQQDSTKLDIKKVYFSSQVLQGSSTEIFADIILGDNMTLTKAKVTLTFPDSTTRELSMEETSNVGEYRAFITDTYQINITYFTIRVESGIYYDTYTNNYEVAAYNVDFVDTVNRVDEILSQPPSLMVAGTDYFSGEPGLSFFQLSENGVAVNNASCFITIYNPNISIWVEDQLMINEGTHGLQYYPFIAPAEEGIYMIAASCEYYKEDQWYYADDDIEFPEYTAQQVEYTAGSARNLNDYADNLYQEVGAIKSGTYYTDQYYLFNKTDSFNFSNSWLVYSGESTSDIPLEFYWWNWTDSSWVMFSNTLQFEAQVSPSALEPVETDQYVSNEIPDEAWNGNLIKVRLYSYDNQDFTNFHNWLNIRGDELVGDVVSNLRGGGEIHISNAALQMVTYFEDILDYLNSTKTHTQFITSNIYNLNETGVIATRLTYSDGEFEYYDYGATCNIVGRGPANSSLGEVIYNTTMTELGQGTYYYSFTPTELGIYQTEVSCYNGVNETYREYNAISQYRVEDDITSISIEGLGDLIEEMNLAFFDVNSNVTDFTIGGIYTQYLNESVAMIFSGTEYNSGEEGIVAMQVLKTIAQGGNEPIDGLSCNSTIWNPGFNGIFESKIMNYTENTYYHDFTVPEEDGVYIDALLCTNPTSGKEYFGMHTFHVAEWANEIVASEYSITVLGTDYEPGDNGRSFIQLVRDGEAINDAVCQLDVYKPTDVQGSIDYFIEDGLMVSMQENGLYYIDFIAPDEVGIYAVSADCSVGQNTTIFSPTSDDLIEGSVSSGSFSDALTSDDVRYEIDEQDNGGGNRSYVHDFYFDFNTLPSLINLAAISFEGRLTPSTTENVKFQVYNYTGGYFADLPNEVISQAGTGDIIVANTGSGECVSAGGDCQNASGFIRIRLQDTVQSGDTSTHTISIDRMAAGVTHLVTAPVIGVSGGGEWNVRNRLSTNFESIINILTQILSDIDTLHQFTEEQVYLITDAMVQLQELSDAKENDIISEPEFETKVLEIKENLKNNGIDVDEIAEDINTEKVYVGNLFGELKLSHTLYLLVPGILISSGILLVKSKKKKKVKVNGFSEVEKNEI